MEYDDRPYGVRSSGHLAIGHQLHERLYRYWWPDIHPRRSLAVYPQHWLRPDQLLRSWHLDKLSRALLPHPVRAVALVKADVRPKGHKTECRPSFPLNSLPLTLATRRWIVFVSRITAILALGKTAPSLLWHCRSPPCL